jgi:hypothetical protein
MDSAEHGRPGHPRDRRQREQRQRDRGRISCLSGGGQVSQVAGNQASMR